MNPGELRHRVTIQQPAENESSMGTVVEGWQPYATVWAAVEPLRGREYLQTLETHSELTARIRIRYLAGITPNMRVLYNNRIFNIVAVIDVDERHRELQLMCSEVT